MSNSLFYKFCYFLYAKTRVGRFYHHRQLRKARRKFNNQGHSVCPAHVFNGLKVQPIAMSLDNYGYLVCDCHTGISVLIDPADTETVQRTLEEENVVPTAILTTHKHWDHAGGNEKLKAIYPDLRIYGNSQDDIPAVTDTIMEGDVLTFGQLIFNVHLTPGHTVGHLIYELDCTAFGAPRSVFSGDHLFVGGIGRIFEGTASVMLKSLDSTMQLPDSSLIWPGHEYTQENLEFAVHLEPDNDAVQNKLKWVQEQRKEKHTTIPSTIGEEKTFNPFLRTDQPSIIQAVGLDKEKDSTADRDALRAKVLAEVRTRKDHFR